MAINGQTEFEIKNELDNGSEKLYLKHSRFSVPKNSLVRQQSTGNIKDAFSNGFYCTSCAQDISKPVNEGDKINIDIEEKNRVIAADNAPQFHSRRNQRILPVAQYCGKESADAFGADSAIYRQKWPSDISINVKSNKIHAHRGDLKEDCKTGQFYQPVDLQITTTNFKKVPKVDPCDLDEALRILKETTELPVEKNSFGIPRSKSYSDSFKDQTRAYSDRVRNKNNNSYSRNSSNHLNVSNDNGNYSHSYRERAYSVETNPNIIKREGPKPSKSVHFDVYDSSSNEFTHSLQVSEPRLSNSDTNVSGNYRFPSGNHTSFNDRYQSLPRDVSQLDNRLSQPPVHVRVSFQRLNDCEQDNNGYVSPLDVAVKEKVTYEYDMKNLDDILEQAEFILNNLQEDKNFDRDSDVLHKPIERRGFTYKTYVGPITSTPVMNVKAEVHKDPSPEILCDEILENVKEDKTFDVIEAGFDRKMYLLEQSHGSKPSDTFTIERASKQEEKLLNQAFEKLTEEIEGLSSLSDFSSNSQDSQLLSGEAVEEFFKSTPETDSDRKQKLREKVLKKGENYKLNQTVDSLVTEPVRSKDESLEKSEKVVLLEEKLVECIRGQPIYSHHTVSQPYLKALLQQEIEEKPLSNQKINVQCKTSKIQQVSENSDLYERTTIQSKADMIKTDIDTLLGKVIQKQGVNSNNPALKALRYSSTPKTISKQSISQEGSVIKEEITSHEIVLEFKYPKTKSRKTNVKGAPFREVSLRRVTKISDASDPDKAQLEDDKETEL